MATSSAFDFETEGSPGTRNQLKRNQQHDISTEFMSNRNTGIRIEALQANGKFKMGLAEPADHGTMQRNKGNPIDLTALNNNATLPRPMSEYADSDGPIYLQAHHGERAFYAPTQTWNRIHEEEKRKSGEISVGEIVGIHDVCGNKRLWRMLIAEFIGTLFLVFIGCGACISGWNPTYAPGTVQIALAFGVTVATIAQAVGHVSGAHLNPAVTIGLLAAGRCSFLKAISYIIFQCGGAICGAAILQASTPVEIQGNLGMTLLNDKLSPVQGLFIEALITFVLVLTVCGVCDDLRKDVKGSAPLAIGLSITVCHLMAIGATGSSMNPARTLGPAVLSKIWAHHWIYWAGPMLGGFCAGFIYHVSFKERPSSDKQ